MRIWIQQFRSMRIGIRFRIRIQIPTKNCENLHMKFFIFLTQKLQSTYPEVSIKEVQATALKREQPALQNLEFFSFFSILVGNFYSPGSVSIRPKSMRIRIRNTDLKSITCEIHFHEKINNHSIAGAKWVNTVLVCLNAARISGGLSLSFNFFLNIKFIQICAWMPKKVKV